MKINTRKWIFLFAAFLTVIFCSLGVMSGEPLVFDKVVNNGVHLIFHETSYPFFKLVSTIGNKKSIGIIAILFLFWLWWRKHDYAGVAIFVLAIGGGKIINEELKTLIARPRPELVHIVNVNSYSYPSGHAMTNFILYYIIAYFLMKEVNFNIEKWFIGLICGSIILVIGLSRIVLQVHYPTDILAGYSIAFLWSSLCLFIYENLMKNQVNLPKY